MNNTFKNIIFGFALLNIAHGAEAGRLEKVAYKSPNIIIFLADDLGWGDLGVYGHSTIKTPNLDKFASEGMLFTNCHSASAVCSPSRASLLTGRTSYRCGFFDVYLKPQQYPYMRESEMTLPKVLKTKGYATCHVGKLHLGSLMPEMNHPSPAVIGYDYWFATQDNAYPSHINPVNFYRNGKPVGEMKGFSSEIIVDEAIDWLEKKPNGKPFFLTVWTHEPHTPIGTDKRFLELYDESLDPVVRKYYGNISQLDYAFGKLMKWLEKKGIKDNTLVIFTSDNGPAWAQNHLDRIHESAGYHRGAKAWLYEGGIRVPGIISYPGMVKKGAICHETINGTDYFPTILDLLNIPLPQDRVIDGISILSLLKGNNTLQRDKPLYWRYDGADGDMKAAYREEDWVLLADRIMDRCELYNLKDDWQQRYNLVYKAEYFERFSTMKKKMVQLYYEIEKEGPNEWWQCNPGVLVDWKQSHPEGIERHLQGVIPEQRDSPYKIFEK